MFLLKGKFVSKVSETIRPKDKPEFNQVSLQLMEEFKSGKSTITTVLVPKDKVNNLKEFKPGEEVTIPVSIDLSTTRDTDRVYRKIWLAEAI